MTTDDRKPHPKRPNQPVGNFPATEAINALSDTAAVPMAPASSQSDDFFSQAENDQKWDERIAAASKLNIAPPTSSDDSIFEKLRKAAQEEKARQPVSRPKNPMRIIGILATIGILAAILLGSFFDEPLFAIPVLSLLLPLFFISQGGMWLVFEKAGISGVNSLIPFLNIWYLHEIAGVSKLLILVWLLPFINILILLVVSLGVARNFGRGVGFGIGLMFAPPIFFSILGFGDYEFEEHFII